jgi:hypothetical protein
MTYIILYYCTNKADSVQLIVIFTDKILIHFVQDEMYVRQWAEGFEGGGVEWGGFVYTI